MTPEKTLKILGRVEHIEKLTRMQLKTNIIAKLIENRDPNRVANAMFLDGWIAGLNRAIQIVKESE